MYIAYKMLHIRLFENFQGRRSNKIIVTSCLTFLSMCCALVDFIMTSTNACFAAEEFLQHTFVKIFSV